MLPETNPISTLTSNIREREIYIFSQRLNVLGLQSVCVTLNSRIKQNLHKTCQEKLKTWIILLFFMYCKSYIFTPDFMQIFNFFSTCCSLFQKKSEKQQIKLVWPNQSKEQKLSMKNIFRKQVQNLLKCTIFATRFPQKIV